MWMLCYHVKDSVKYLRIDLCCIFYVIIYDYFLAYSSAK